jgi:hypothetical protein
MDSTLTNPFSMVPVHLARRLEMTHCVHLGLRRRALSSLSASDWKCGASDLDHWCGGTTPNRLFYNLYHCQGRWNLVGSGLCFQGVRAQVVCIHSTSYGIERRQNIHGMGMPLAAMTTFIAIPSSINLLVQRVWTSQSGINWSLLPAYPIPTLSIELSSSFAFACGSLSMILPVEHRFYR